MQSTYPDAQAHPRSRGENCLGTVTSTVLYGSSPLTRGKPVKGQNAKKISGLIPAHAGKTKKTLTVTRL